MKRVQIRTVADMEALPEGEWVEVPAGTKLEVLDETVAVPKRRTITELSPELAGQLRAGGRDQLKGHVSAGKRAAAKGQARPASRRRRATAAARRPRSRG